MRPQQLAVSHIPGLDGVRALAVMAVVWHHSHPGVAWLPASANGFLGVDLFFALSGLLITTLLLREQAMHGQISLTNFYARRALRIFPLYYALLALLTLYFVWAPESPQRGAFLAALPFHASYLSNWIQPDSLMAISWSLSTEEQFYLVWPPLLVLLGTWALPWLLAFLLLNQAVNFGWLDGWLRSMGMPYESLDILQATFTPIVLGVLLAFALQNDRAHAWLRRLLTPRSLWVLVLAGVVLLNWPGSLRGWPRLGLHLVITLLLGALVMNPGHVLVRSLQWRPLAYVGTVSYGIYLLHKPALDVARRLLHMLAIDSPLGLFGLGLLLSVGVAAISYRYFESPLLRLKNAFRAPRPKTVDTAFAESRT
ncbi:MAG TPA: acyltransferase [Ideonella sp.]|uniref:acyltransferase family protein n=1 Tax=Ideonella sp. TaxID=1929293 RepID=UPI002E31B9D7|nr:acyltransferase [Ideonella sp.]HEX5686495.1 acyltransferase [Ideonella sp.]